MNPFTRFLRQWHSDPDFEAFVDYWDSFEALVIQLYRSRHFSKGDGERFEALRNSLLQSYPRCEPRFREYWTKTAVAGATLAEDPFRTLLAVKSPAGFIGNWAALQQLPAAREAINRYLQTAAK